MKHIKYYIFVQDRAVTGSQISVFHQQISVFICWCCRRLLSVSTTTSRNMTAILQLIGRLRHAALVYSFNNGHWCYDQLTLVKTRYPLTSITWLYRGLRLRAHPGHLFFFLDTWCYRWPPPPLRISWFDRWFVLLCKHLPYMVSNPYMSWDTT